MRAWMPFALFILTILTGPTAFAFEGEIQATATDSDSVASKMTVLISNAGDVRLSTVAKADGQSMKVGYIKPVKGKFNYTIDHRNKVVSKIPKAMFDRMASQMRQVDFDKKNMEAKKLGKEKIAGYMTRHIRITDKDTGDVSDIWLSDKLPARLWSKLFTFGSQTQAMQAKHWEKAAKKLGFKPGFMLKMLHKEKSGEVSGIEITKISKHKVPKSQFAPPSGYEVKDINVPGALGGQRHR